MEDLTHVDIKKQSKGRDNIQWKQTRKMKLPNEGVEEWANGGKRMGV